MSPRLLHRCVLGLFLLFVGAAAVIVSAKGHLLHRRLEAGVQASAILLRLLWLSVYCDVVLVDSLKSLPVKLILDHFLIFRATACLHVVGLLLVMPDRGSRGVLALSVHVIPIVSRTRRNRLQLPWRHGDSVEIR